MKTFFVLLFLSHWPFDVEKVIKILMTRGRRWQQRWLWDENDFSSLIKLECVIHAMMMFESCCRDDDDETHHRGGVNRV